MATVVKIVLARGYETKGAIDLCIDNILIVVTKISTIEVVNHLEEFRLTTKPPESLEEEAMLSLKLKKKYPFRL